MLRRDRFTKYLEIKAYNVIRRLRKDLQELCNDNPHDLHIVHRTGSLTVSKLKKKSKTILFEHPC